jgi:hypothetical protein
MNDQSNESTNKQIIIESKNSNSSNTGNKNKTKKQPVMRKVVHKNKWNFEPSDFSFDNQIQNIRKINENLPPTPHMEIYTSEIKNKLNGYRSQDIIKKIYDTEQFVDFKSAIDLLLKSNLDCFYCKEKVEVLYEPSRTPKQWTLERLDNQFGHNKDNLVIACLHCNLHRKTMYHERFVFTKQLGIITKLDS